MVDTLSIVIPCFNSAKTLRPLVEALIPVVSKISNKYEVIFINDASADATWNRILELREEYPHLRAINFSKNYGQHNATLCGIRSANYDLIVTLDDDLQNPPAEIANLLAHLERGYDVVYGVPKKRKCGLVRTWGSKGVRYLLHIVGAQSAGKISSFRALRTSVRSGFHGFSGQPVCVDVLFAWSTEKIGSVLVEHNPRVSGVSSYSMARLFRIAYDLFFSYSAYPLRLLGATGAVVVALGVALVAISISECFSSGFALSHFVLPSVFVIGGIQLLGLGIVGEYLVRLYSACISQPAYNVLTEMRALTEQEVSAKSREKPQAGKLAVQATRD